MTAKSSVPHWIAVAAFKDKGTWSKKGSKNWKTQIYEECYGALSYDQSRPREL